MRHHTAGRLAQAEKIYQQILQADPDQPDALHLLGLVAHQMGKYDSAVELISKAITHRPDHAEAHNNLGNALQALGQLGEAESCYQKAIAIKPDYAQAHNNLGMALQKQGKPDQAVASYHKALAITPDYAEAHINLGNTLQDQGKFDEALTSYHTVLAIKPDHAGAHNNLGLALHSLGRLDDAVVSFHRALDIDPDYAEAQNNLGNAFQHLGKLDEAVACFHKALALKPDYAQAHSNLGNAFQELGRLDDAIAAFRQALRIKPDFDIAAANLLHQLRHACAWPDVEELEPKVSEFTERSIHEGGPIALRPFDNVTSRADASENFAVARARSRQITKKMSGLKGDFPMSGRRSPKPRITIGYLSGDFQNHPIAHLMLGLFELHDRNDFNVFTFSFGQNDESPYRGKIKTDSDRFIDLQTTGHLEAARQIYDSGVDILVDLHGHTRNNRLEICALRPAPVQAAYLGFPGTTGADFLDYILTDPIVTPEDQAPYYSEQLVYLPHCYQINDHNQKISDAPVTRTNFGLPEEGLIFCSFNSNYKIEPVMFELWMDLLKKVPGSVLWLLRSNDLAERHLRAEAQSRGVDTDRLIFAEWMAKDQHLARTRLADLALDTRICGGHTTTCDALWAGVPVVTMLGTHFASRVSASILSAVGLPELITDNLEDYQTLALRLSQNPDELDDLKIKLARNRLSEPLFDTPRFVRNLENAYRRMWENYLTGKSPTPIDVMEE
ncbi:MAG: tetratricopeptide repeat protein [Rhodospirillales bacterium]|nr:tetratricopeptide repeat protein [Rhodospirillales bacterium]